MRHVLVTAVLGGASLALMCSMTLNVEAVDSGVTVRTLTQGSVKALPPGKIFINILEFKQVPGADFGPHPHLPAVVYTVRGTSTITFPAGPAVSAGPGQAVFIPAGAPMTQKNVDGRLVAIAIAGGLIVLVILLSAATLLRGRSRRTTIAVLSALAIFGGIAPVLGATSNDYYFIAVRPDAQHVLAMPRPDGHVFYTSPDVDPVPAGPYVETLSAITVPAGVTYDAPVVRGPQIVVILQGNAKVQVGDQTSQLGVQGATMAQAGQTIRLVNSGSDALQVLDYAVASVAASSPAA